MNRASLAAATALALVAPTTLAAQTRSGSDAPEVVTRDQPVATPKPEPLDSVRQTPLLQQWKPRAWLSARGIDVTAHFIGEVAGNDRGYISAGWDYTQSIDIGAVIDLQKLGVANSGIVRIAVSDRLGHGLHQDRTGAYIQNQAYYGQGANARFDELSYERTFMDKRLSLKGGFYAMGNDFAGLPYTCNFNNNGNCGHPLGLLYGSGWTDNPTGQWGGRVKWSDRSGFYAETGVYDVTPSRKRQEHGFQIGFDNNTGVIAPLEIGYVHGKTPSDYAGTYKIGLYYDTSNTTDLSDPTRRAHGRTGGYIQAAQQIWKPHPGVVQGVSIFGVATLNDARTGLFRTFYELGTSWRGIVPSRGDDIASISWTQATINANVIDTQIAAGTAHQGNEQLWEVNYGTQIAPWLLLRPGLQYVVHPGGYSTRPDSVVFTLHLQATI
jgi:porin